MTAPLQPDPGDLRSLAVTQLQRRRELGGHVLAYVMVNAMLLVIWAITDAAFFWPVIPLLVWGVGVVFHAWDVLLPGPSEARIQREIEHLRRR